MPAGFIKPNLDLKKITKEYIGLIYCVIILIAAFFVYSNFLNPLLKKNRLCSQQIEQRKNDIRKAKSGASSLVQFEQEIEQLKPQMEYYQKGLQTEVDIPQILNELNRKAERLNIRFVSVNPLEKEELSLPGKKEILWQIPIRIKMESGYHQLGIFINEIENSPRFMKILSFDITTDPINIWVHKSELVVASYRLVEKQ